MQLQDYIIYYHSNYLKKLLRNYARATRAQCTSVREGNGNRGGRTGRTRNDGRMRGGGSKRGVELEGVSANVSGLTRLCYLPGSWVGRWSWREIQMLTLDSFITVEKGKKILLARSKFGWKSKSTLQCCLNFPVISNVSLDPIQVCPSS